MSKWIDSDAWEEDDLGRREAEVVSFRLRLKAPMVCNEQISKGIEFQRWEQSNGMSDNQSWCWMKSGGDSAGQRSEEDWQVGDGE